MMVEPVAGKPKSLLGSYDVADVGDRVEHDVAGTATTSAKPVEATGYPTTTCPAASRP